MLKDSSLVKGMLNCSSIKRIQLSVAMLAIVDDELW